MDRETNSGFECVGNGSVLVGKKCVGIELGLWTLRPAVLPEVRSSMAPIRLRTGGVDSVVSDR
jgi:hypothetical protein